jgi:S1-C subfamily serine protease
MTTEISVSQIGSSAGTLYLYAGEGTGGAIPVTVIAGSAAYSAGMRTGDEITHIEGIPVDSSSYLSVISLMEGGSEVQVDYTRDGVAGHAMVRCTTDRIRSSDQMEISGIYIDTATDADGKTCGAIVMSIAEGSPWYKAGLRAGDVIIGMDGKTVEDVSGLDGVEGAKQISYMCGGHAGIVEVEDAKRAAEESKAEIEKRYSEAVEPAKPSLDTRIIAGPVRNPFLDAVRPS